METPYNWSEKDKYYLEPFVTNPDGLISVLRNLPPEIAGALCSRASRASGSLLEVFLKEYIYPIINGEDKVLSEELENTVKFFHEHGFKKILNNQRAQAFYAKWLSQYGDDSIAQMTGTHVVFWGISQVAMKFIEDQRIGLEPIEKSTRYVNFGNKVNGHYLYHVPEDDLRRTGFFEEYERTLDHLFDTYIRLMPPLLDWLKKNYEEKESILEKKAFDTLRGLLPMATLGQLAMRGNAQALEYLINRTAKHHLSELRWISGALKKELDEEIPSLLLRVNDEPAQKYQAYLSGRHNSVRKYIKEENLSQEKTISGQPSVKLVEYDKDAVNKVIAGILFEHTHESWENLLKTASSLDETGKKKIISSYLSGRSERWQKVGRAFENSYLRFEITMNIGAYRDLHRHRMMTQERQLFSAHHGYDMPEEIKEAGLEGEFSEALEKARELFFRMEKVDPGLAQYTVPLAYRIRFFEWQNLRQMFWESELRTISQGHPDYRKIEQEKWRVLKEKLPLISEFILVDMNDYKIARRGTEEQIKKKEEFLINELKKKK
ncbi:FAD-dependent thymidylate synthase [Patescibacteria group bacterium]|nr:FAD-dependent thymidylate synthase [Patescibacteria group bacterium]